MDAPSPPPPQPLDPLTQQAEKQAQNQLVAGLQTQARGDMGSLMAAYGKLAMNMGSTGTTPIANALFGKG
jgi:hypothetical protein